MLSIRFVHSGRRWGIVVRTGDIARDIGCFMAGRAFESSYACHNGSGIPVKGINADIPARVSN